jgi:hypothetical protein
LGNLYNKEAILTAILEKTLPEACAHIRGLKDLKTLEFTDNPRCEEGNMESVDDHIPLFICPVTRQEFNGSYPFYAIWTTGKVLSDKAIKEMGTEALQSEYGPFSAIDMVRLLPGEHEMDEQRAVMHRRRELQSSSKKQKKEKKDKADRTSDEVEPISKKRKSEESKHKTHDAPKLSVADAVVSTAAKEIETKKSEVFKSLFHKDAEKDKKDRDLFMSVAGIRYTL